MIKKTEAIAEIKPIELIKVPLRIVGDSPLIEHAWSHKAKQMILDKQMKKTKTRANDAKNPVEDFIESMYWLSCKPEEFTEEAFYKAVDNGARWGFPVTGIKQATINTAYRSGLTKDKASMRGVFFFDGEGPEQLVEIKGDVPHIREDMVRIGMGTADIRFRGQFDNWYADIVLTYNKNGPYTLEQIINLINIGGFSCGLGEYRPERDGTYGTYHVEAIK